MSVLFTLFDSPAAPSKRESTLTLDGLRGLILATSAPTKSGLPWLKMARFGDVRSRKGSLRHNANVLEITGIEGDYDGETMAPSVAVASLDIAGIAALVYTSPSHRPERPRWRVLCPTSAPLPPDQRAALVGRLNAVLGGVLSRESFALSQAYYFGAVTDGAPVQTWIVGGTPIDRAGLTAEAYPQSAVAAPLPALPAGLPPDAHCQAALDRARDLLTAPEAVGQRHQALLTAAMLLAPMVKSGHMDYGAAVLALSDAMESSGRVPNEGEVDGALSGAMPRVWPYVPVTQGEEFDAIEPPQPVNVAELTEDACALAFAETYADRFRFDASAGGGPADSTGAWYRFGGDGWERDRVNSVYDTARAFVRGQRAARGFGKDTRTAGGAGFPAGVVRMARTDPRLVTVSGQWDADPWRLGVPGGWVDLRTGTAHPAAPGVLIRRQTSVAPADRAECPTWLRFLEAATAGDASLIAWLQRLAGYLLTGDTREEIFAFFYGPGGNGKGTFLGALEAVLGGYAYKAPTELFKTDGRVNREYQLAALESVRAVFASETEQGAFLAESFVKEITGNEGALSARHIYGAPFTFRPTFKLIIVGNHAPRLSGRSAAMERRMRVVPFNVRPESPDPNLKDRLVSEYPGILRWALDGCLAWQREGLGSSGAVAAASGAYFQDQDSIAEWLEECCSITPGGRYPSGDALASFNAWARARGQARPVDAKAFKRDILARPGIGFMKSDGARVFTGIAPGAPEFP